MRNRLFKILLILLITFPFIQLALSQDWYSELSQKEKDLYNEHLKFGQPNNEELLIRNAYVLHYNTQYRIPNWVAYHIKPDYRKTPTREGKFKTFKTDKDVEDPVKDEEYDGLYSSKKYDRGHLTPFGIMGGDRNGNGVYANYESEANSDKHDEETVFQGSRMSNIAPQHAKTINRSPGLWFQLERWIQDDLVVANNKEVWVYAGCIVFDTRNIEGVGKNDSIVVPNMFYKVVIMESQDQNKPHVLAFLFPHFRNKDDLKENSIHGYLVPIDYIEAITGLDFFSKIDEADQKEFESKVVIDSWEQYIDNK